MYGYHGKVLIVDLTTMAVDIQELPEDVLKKYIGGTGLAAYLLYQHCPVGVEPLSPDNPLIFVTSPLVGSGFTTSSKYVVVSKSPLTGFIGDSISSSFMATELKKTGYDALILKGKAPYPAILHLTDESVSLDDAAQLVGLDTAETERAVKEKMGSGTRVACIGPAGEKLVRYASITNDGGRQAARTGPGAVMGSKNLKAIAVKGTMRVPAFDEGKVNETRRELSKRSLGPATEKYRNMGTIANISVFNELGTLPTRNFQEATFGEAESFSGEQLHEAHFVKNAHCASCTIGCEKIMVTKDSGAEKSGRMEYESAFALGSLLGISDPNAVIRASVYCDEMGMDTISAGGTIAWAMECFDKGILTSDDTGGIDLRFGNAEAVMECLRLIASREGIGGLLAEGSRNAARKVGQGSEAWAMHVKGLEMPGYEPRSLQTMALALAVSTRGACHNRSSAYEADLSSAVDRLSSDDLRGRITADGEDYSALLDSMIWCKFLRKAFKDFYEESASIYKMVTGITLTSDDLRIAGERINNLKKMFNIREGWHRSDDTLPTRALTERLPSGVAQGAGLTEADLNMMIDSYYLARGWSSDGTISDGKLEELGIEFLPDRQTED